MTSKEKMELQDKVNEPSVVTSTSQSSHATETSYNVDQYEHYECPRSVMMDTWDPEWGKQEGTPNRGNGYENVILPSTPDTPTTPRARHHVIIGLAITIAVVTLLAITAIAGAQITQATRCQVPN